MPCSLSETSGVLLGLRNPGRACPGPVGRPSARKGLYFSRDELMRAGLSLRRLLSRPGRNDKLGDTKQLYKTMFSVCDALLALPRTSASKGLWLRAN